MNRSIPHCPVCNSTMEPVKLRCSSCHITVEGELPVSRLALLVDEHQQFIEAFLLARGNIRELEKELGISYPTVRKRLEEVVQALGYPAREKRLDQREILDAVDRGELSPQEAIAQLRGI